MIKIPDEEVVLQLSKHHTLQVLLLKFLEYPTQKANYENKYILLLITFMPLVDAFHSMPFVEALYNY